MKLLMIAVSAVIAGLSFLQPVHADARLQDVVTEPGWNMVGGPPGTTLPQAAALYFYTGSAYARPESSNATLCRGYWAYFGAQGGGFVLNGQPPAGSSQTCSLRAGWNLVGNPFAAGAELPAGTLAYHWNPLRGGYDRATEISLGGADWVYSVAPSSITLEAIVGSLSTVLINSLSPPSSPYRIHVGDTVELRLDAFGPTGYQIAADPAYLSLESATSIGAEPVRYDFRWRAIAAGTATIMATLLPQGTTTTISITVVT